MLAILDWGIGGIGFYRLLQTKHPHVPVIYFSDSGAVPYGRMSASVLTQRIRAVAQMLHGRGASHLVVACNAASTTLPRLGISNGAVLQASGGTLRVTGVIHHGVGLARKSHSRRLGIIGGARTIRAGIYRQELHDTRTKVHQRIAQPLSAHIEAGRISGHALEHDIEKILRPLRGKIDTLLLACTHYPAISWHLQVQLPGVRLLDPAQAMLDWVEKNWPLEKSVRQPSVFATTGDPMAMQQAAWRAWGVTIDAIQPLTEPLHSTAHSDQPIG